ncbi:hypothetical protein QM027_03485 [Campylobacter concisus]
MKEKKLIIKDIQGEIYVISQDGSIKMLKDGDEIYAGEKILLKFRRQDHFRRWRAGKFKRSSKHKFR